MFAIIRARPLHPATIRGPPIHPHSWWCCTRWACWLIWLGDYWYLWCFPRGYPACGCTFLCLPFRVSVVAVDITSLTTLPFLNSAILNTRDGFLIVTQNHNTLDYYSEFAK